MDRTQSILAETEDLGNRFYWSKAARSYRTYLHLLPKDDPAKRGEALEQIGLYRFNATMQSRTASGFRNGIRKALSTQKEASRCFKELGADGKARFLRCLATEAYLAYWIAKNPSKKRYLLDESWNLTKKSLQSFESSKRHSEYAETYNRLSLALAISLECDWNLRSRVRKSNEAIERGRKAISFLRSAENKFELVKALVRTSLFLDSFSDVSPDPSKLREIQREALHIWKEAVRISKDAAIQETSRPPQGFQRILDLNQNLTLCKDALRIARHQRDNFATGWVSEKLAKWTFYAAEAIENPTLRVKQHTEGLHFAEIAAKIYDVINFTSAGGGVLWVHSPYAEHFLQLASYETDSEKRRRLQEKSFRSSPELLRLARRSEHPSVNSYAFHISSKSAVSLAEIETNKRRKKRLLREGLARRMQSYKIVEQTEPVASWNRGANLRYLADTQARLAGLEEDPEKEKELLEKAAVSQERGLRSATDYVQSLERPESHILRGPLGRYHLEFGDILLRLNSITKDEKYLRKAANEYATAAEWYESVSRYWGSAACYWKSAETYDLLQAHSLASESFTLASEAYARLGRRNPPLKEFSQDYKNYLIAWSKIELARAAHLTLQSDQAARFYESAARLHKSTKRWRFLTPYYSAWSKLESGESHSKNGRRTGAVRAFRESARLFAESKTSLKTQLALLDQPDERRMVAKLAEVPIEMYCHARVILEEAMVAENQEDYRASFEKFGFASEKLREVSTLSEFEQDRKEIGFLSTLCEAWQLSSKAELDGSTELLREASSLFGKARAMSPSIGAMKLASGHEAFCRALIASRKFADTLDPTFHEEASRQMDLATTYYLESGFKTASDHATARKLLLDAFAQLNSASGEQDQKKKAGLYRMTSALLRESADAFLRAQQPRKREQALRLLEKARRESKIASHLTEILDAASDAPTNVAFSTPGQGDEKAVGLDRFERADIEVRLARITKRPPLEKDVEFEIEITNTGKQPIRLVRLDEAVPESVELRESSEMWKPHGRSLMATQSKRIDTLQTEALKIMVRPKTEGLLRIRPKVIFIDAAGVQSERVIEPKVVATSQIMEFLANAFAEEYTSRRLALPNSGWRTLMEIVHKLKIPRSHVYGEPRYGRTFGKQLESLIRSSLVEYRIFPGERGRGGDITKVRVLLDNQDVREYVEELARERPDPFTSGSMFPADIAKGQTETALAR